MKAKVFKNKAAHKKLGRVSKIKTYTTKKGTISKIQKSNYSDVDWRTLAKKVKDRYKNRCAYCSSTEALEVHHIISLSRGGTNSVLNLICLCKNCHSKRHRHLLMRKK